MMLVDTCVWINHLRRGDAVLMDLLQTGQILAHPFIIGELRFFIRFLRIACIEFQDFSSPSQLRQLFTSTAAAIFDC